jgi:hypothetical protein
VLIRHRAGSRARLASFLLILAHLALAAFLALARLCAGHVRALAPVPDPPGSRAAGCVKLGCPTIRAALFQNVESGMGHNVLTPDPTSQHMATPDDLALLLADLVRAVRLDDRALLLEPPPSLCPSCSAVYSTAWQIVGDAGGVKAWVAEFERRPRERSRPRR